MESKYLIESGITAKYEGYAFKPDSEQEATKISERYEEIKHLKPELEITKTPTYGSVDFEIHLPKEMPVELTELSVFDFLILADEGNLCFGGKAKKFNDKINGTYFTD